MRGSKYKACKTEYAGERFDSKKDKGLWLKYGPCPLRVVKMTCRYQPDELPTIRKIDYQIVKSSSDKRRYSPINEAWLSATA